MWTVGRGDTVDASIVKIASELNQSTVVSPLKLYTPTFCLRVYGGVDKP